MSPRKVPWELRPQVTQVIIPTPTEGISEPGDAHLKSGSTDLWLVFSAGLESRPLPSLTPAWGGVLRSPPPLCTWHPVQVTVLEVHDREWSRACAAPGSSRGPGRRQSGSFGSVCSGMVLENQAVGFGAAAGGLGSRGLLPEHRARGARLRGHSSPMSPPPSPRAPVCCGLVTCAIVKMSNCFHTLWERATTLSP